MLSGKWRPFYLDLNGLMSSKYDLWSTFATVMLHTVSCSNWWLCFNSSPPEQNGRYFVDNIFKYIPVNEKFYIFINISLKLVPKGQINSIPALVQIMAWHQIGNKPLPEPMVT